MNENNAYADQLRATYNDNTENMSQSSEPNSQAVANEAPPTKTIYASALPAQTQAASLQPSFSWSKTVGVITLSTLVIGTITTLLIAGTEKMALFTSRDANCLLLGQFIGAINIALAMSVGLWEYWLRERNTDTTKLVRVPLAVTSLFTWLLQLPIGIAIAACLFYIFSDNNSITLTELLIRPLEISLKYSWILLWLAPLMLITWFVQSLLVERWAVINTAGVFTNSPFGATMATNAQGFAVKRRNTPARCDICHQEDMFVGKTGFCKRCQRYTV